MMKKISLLMCASLLSGCSFLSQEEALPLYTLKSGPVDSGQVLSTSIAIDMPICEASLDTERIAVTPSPYERDYLADGQWPERLPKIVQAVLLESLGTRWGTASVGRIGSGIQMNELLQTEIQDFSVYHLGTLAPEVHLKVSFKIINLRTRKVLAGRTFEGIEKVCLTSMTGIVEAFNNGFRTLLQQAMPWMEGTVLKESALNVRNNKLGRHGG